MCTTVVDHIREVFTTCDDTSWLLLKHCLCPRVPATRRCIWDSCSSCSSCSCCGRLRGREAWGCCSNVLCIACRCSGRYAVEIGWWWCRAKTTRLLRKRVCVYVCVCVCVCECVCVNVCVCLRESCQAPSSTTNVSRLSMSMSVCCSMLQSGQV